MCLLLETISIENGKVSLLAYHQERLNRSRYELWKTKSILSLEEVLGPILPHYRQGLYKCRLVYGKKVEQVEVLPYQRPQIQSLKKVYHPTVDYHLKYKDRELLAQLYADKGECDDILIIKKGIVTDSYFANILFSDGKHWFTSDQPLLKGVQRQFLLDTARVKAIPIQEDDLSRYQFFTFVNALNPLAEGKKIAVEYIY
ncbi:aminotransferase class IV [Porifericola rhodea]|uniref:aminotransferase class IV n=1 Tax=Porifericola rhodea TaxID=930972 RepID=UPI0026668417|nr:aminotransferase class IV [Porifericola rhodea]WKN32660.1 aminotransferase class IV [Porifericola rhodea]